MHRLTIYSLGQRAVIALVTVAIAVFGVVGLSQLKRELIPSLEIPVAVVVTPWLGSSSDLVDQQLSEPIAAALRAVPGVVATTATSSNGISTVTVELEFGTDVSDAAAEVERAVDRVPGLPDNVDPQVITGSIADLPVIQVAVSSDVDAATLAGRLQREVIPELAGIEGVRDVTLSGGEVREVHIALNPLALAATGVNPAAIATVLQDNGVVIPAGTITQDDQTLPVQAGSRIESVEALADVPVGTGSDGTVVRLGEVAQVDVQTAAPTSYSRVDGRPSLTLAITKTPDGNTVAVSHAVQEILEEARPSLGEAEVTVVFDQAPFIEKSIEDLSTEGALGLLFAVIVIAVFLRSVRSTLVAAVSIPASVLITFIGLWAGGETLNILTLGGLTAAIGRVVDDSIVVIENIKRHLSYGEARSEAILTGVREVASAVTSSTLTSVAVFLPIALVGGFVGELFSPFAITVSLAIGASLLVSLTIVPVLSYWFLPAHAAETAQERAAERAAAEAKERRTWLQRGYVPSLRLALARPVVTLVAAAAILVGTFALVPRLETNFIGDTGQNTLTVTATFAPGTSLAAQDARARQVEEALAEVPAIQTVQTTVGSGDAAAAAFGMTSSSPTAQFAVTLDTGADATAVQDAVRERLAELDDVGRIAVSGQSAGFAASTIDIAVTSDEPDDLSTAARIVEEAVSDLEDVTDVANNLATAQPRVDVEVDAAAAAAAGLTEAQVVQQVAAALMAPPIGTLTIDGQTTGVRLVAGGAPATVEELTGLPIPTPSGVLPLGALADVVEVEAPASITRVDGVRSATISVTPVSEDLGSVTASLQQVVGELDLPAGSTVEIGGVAADQQEAFADLGLALVVAVIIVYVIMVATFGSLLQPLILLVSIPFAATGALLALLVTGTPLGVPALIGLLMLVGIVVTNAIVLIDLINQYRKRGRSVADAVAEGARKRVRPIVMTAAATICALTPMALGVTGGSVFISAPLALVVIGGLMSSTVLTVILVPVLYTLVERRREGHARHRDATRTDETDAGAPAVAAPADTAS